MFSKGKGALGMFGALGAAGIALTSIGTYALFSASTGANSDTFAVGTVQLQEWAGDSCVPPTSTTSTGLTVGTLYPGNERSQEFTVMNTGSLDEWVGILAHLPTNIPLKVKYTITVDGPYSANSGGEPDANGDLHSNCHTGSKGLGAGGEDKSGQEDDGDTTIAQYSVGWFTTSDTTPQQPFELPVGDHAHITYTYQLAKGDSSLQNRNSPLSFDVWSVQYRNNVSTPTSGGQPGPISWAPQPAS